MRIGLAALLVVATLLAAACNGGAAESSPTSSATSMPVSSPTAKPSSSPAGPATTGPNVRPGERPPIMPAAAKQHTQEGALAFAGYFIKALDWSNRDNWMRHRLSKGSLRPRAPEPAMARFQRYHGLEQTTG